MHRRAVILAGLALPWSPHALAQPRKPLIAWLNQSPRQSALDYLLALKAGLAELGWKEGAYRIEERWAGNVVAQLPALAAELAALKPDVIVASPNNPVRAAHGAAPATPIVAIAGEPVKSGFAASYARPGGMITGISNITTDVVEKYLELLLAALPETSRIAFLLESTNVLRQDVMESARRSVARTERRLEARFVEVATLQEVEAALPALVEARMQAVIMPASPLFLGQRKALIGLLLAHRLPAVGHAEEIAEAGALISYGSDPRANFRRAAHFVDRILKGAKAADLPIELPSKLRLVVNVRTARLLELDVAKSFLVRADRVIH